MTTASSTASRWAVSTRTHGEVLTAGASAPALEVALLGVPPGFTVPEIEGWLRDLAGVASETSAGDPRVRAIPPLLHHALTGLLFSQAELWSRLEGKAPCAAAFVETPDACAFGWVGEARVQVLVDGQLVEPQWVHVRDEQGREALAASFATGTRVVVSLDYWPAAAEDSAAPSAIEAEWIPGYQALTGPLAESAAAHVAQAAPDEASVEVPASAPGPSPAAHDAEPAVSAPALPDAPNSHEGLGLPEALQAEQPGLSESSRESAAPSHTTGEARASVEEAPAPETPVEAAPLPATFDEQIPGTSGGAEASRPDHPIARWLTRVMGWGRRAPRLREIENVATDATPLSTYDSLISDEGPQERAREQTAFDLGGAQAATDAETAGLDAGGGGGGRDTRAGEDVSPAPAEMDARFADAWPPAQPVASMGVEQAPPVWRPAPPAAPGAAEQAPPVWRPAQPDEPRASEASPPPSAWPPAEAAAAARAADSPLLDEALALAEELSRAESALGPAPGAGVDATAQPVSVPPSPVPAPADVVPTDPRVREMHDVDASTLPPLSPAPVASGSTAPLRIESEPPGAAEGFAIPALAVPTQPPPPPSAEQPGIATGPPRIVPSAPPVLRVSAPVPQQAGPPVLRTEPPSAPPAGPPVLRVSEAPAPATGPPVLRVSVPEGTPTAPPVLRVSPGSPAVSPIVPTPPVAPIAPSEGGGALEVDRGFDGQAAAPPAIARPAWPAFDETRPRALHQQPWFWAALVAVVFAAGWLLGGTSSTARKGPGPIARLMHAVGLGPASFSAAITSTPPGAWIAVDGRDIAQRTPATLDLTPGSHTVVLTLTDLGSASFPLHGARDEKVPLDVSLEGSLDVQASDPGLPIVVGVDGRPQGYAPVHIDSLAPGLHEVQFSGPGVPAWAQTVQVGVGKTTTVMARPISAPANGVIQVQATMNDDRGSSPLSGAQVYVDGDLRGRTPISLDLPRGPHSLRVTWKDETAAVQVIDLPGGNQRFASFNFGLGSPAPRVALPAALHAMSASQTSVVQATLDGLQSSDVRETWLHVRAPEGLWRRYPMTLLPGATDPVAAVVFPPGSFDAQGQTKWYVSVLTQQGDEYFSEVQTSVQVGGAAARPAGGRRHR